MNTFGPALEAELAYRREQLIGTRLAACATRNRLRALLQRLVGERPVTAVPCTRAWVTMAR